MPERRGTCACLGQQLYSRVTKRDPLVSVITSDITVDASAKVTIAQCCAVGRVSKDMWLCHLAHAW
jgi:hypothetical protein